MKTTTILAIMAAIAVPSFSLAASSDALALPKSTMHVPGIAYAPRMVDGEMCFDPTWYSHPGNVGKNVSFSVVSTWKIDGGRTLVWFDETPKATSKGEKLLGGIFDKNNCMVIDKTNQFKATRELVLSR